MDTNKKAKIINADLDNINLLKENIKKIDEELKEVSEKEKDPDSIARKTEADKNKSLS